MNSSTDWDQTLSKLEAGLRKRHAEYTETGDTLTAEVFFDLMEVAHKFKAEGFSAEEVVKKTLSYSHGWTEESLLESEHHTPEEREEASAYIALERYTQDITGIMIESFDWAKRSIILRQNLLSLIEFYDNRSDQKKYRSIALIYLTLLKVMDSYVDDDPQVGVNEVFNSIEGWRNGSSFDLDSTDSEDRERAEAYAVVYNSLQGLFTRAAVRDWDGKAEQLKTGLANQVLLYSGIAQSLKSNVKSFIAGAESYKALAEEMDKAEREGMKGRELVEHISDTSRKWSNKASENWSFENTEVRNNAFVYTSMDKYVQELIYSDLI